MYQRLLFCCLIHSLISVSVSYVPVKDGRHSIKSTEESVSKLEHHDEHEVKHKNFDLTPTAVHTKYESSFGKHNHKDLNQKDVEHEIKHIFKELKEDSHGDESILIKSDPVLEQKSHAKDEHKLHGEDHHKHSDDSSFIYSRRNPSLYHSEEHIDDRDKVDFNVFKINSHQSDEFDGIGDVHDHRVDFNIFKRSHIHEEHDDIAKKHLHHEEANAHKHHDLSLKDTKVIEHSACENKDYHAPLPHDKHHGHVEVSGFEKHDAGSTVITEKCHDEHHLHGEKKTHFDHHFDKHLDKASEVHHHASGKSEHKHDAKPLECEPKTPEHSLHHHQDHVPHHDHHFKPHTPVKDHHREDSHEFGFSSEEYHHKHHPHVHPHHHDYDYHHHHHHPHHHHDSHHYGHHYHH